MIPWTWRSMFGAHKDDVRRGSEQSVRGDDISFDGGTSDNSSRRPKLPLLAKVWVLLLALFTMTSILRWRRRGHRDENINVALCFFGISRSLRWTFPSIESRVYDVLRKEGIDYDVFVHTYTLKEINNKRNNEKHVAYGNFTEDYRLLSPTGSLVTNQDDLDLAFPDPVRRTHYHWKYYNDGTASDVIRNVFRAYWSMMLAWEIMAEHAHENDIQYDAVVLLRPDLWYHKKIEIGRRHFPLPEKLIYMPKFSTDTAPKGRKNDRFSYGSVEAMRVMFHRIDTLFESGVENLTHKSLDSEYVLGRHLWLHDMSVRTIRFPMSRVRMDGTIPSHDHERVRDVCKAGLDPMACVIFKLGYRFPMDSTQEELFELAN